VLLGLENGLLEGDLVCTPVREAHFALLVRVIRVSLAIFIIIRKRENPRL
jgi:hypothetical protein